MDSEVIKVFLSVDHILSFVEDVDKLKGKSHRFFKLIEESLHIIANCGKFILEYLYSSTKGMIFDRLSLISTDDFDKIKCGWRYLTEKNLIFMRKNYEREQETSDGL